MIVLDTNLVIALLKGHKASSRLYQQLYLKDQIGISILSFCEILSGIEEKHHDSFKTALSEFLLFPFDHVDIATQAAVWRKNLKISLADAIIAATCLYHGAKFYTFDRDFKKLKQDWISVMDYE